MEETINLYNIMKMLKKRITLIFTIILITFFIVTLFTFFIVTPQYQASTQLLVNQEQSAESEITSEQLESSREFINTYSVIMTSPTILEPVLESTNTNISVEEFRNKVTVSSEEESQVATVMVEYQDPQKAVELANSLTRIFEEEIPNIMDVNNVSILSEAQMSSSDNPVSPQPILNLFIGLIIGTLLGVGSAIILELFDKSIKNEEDIEKYLNIPILGTIPQMSEQEINKSKDKKENKYRSNARGI